MSDSPQSFDRYEIVRLLGKGGMGTVFLARDQRLGRNVALKVLNDDELSSEERKGRFLREARVAAAIRHPNVGTIYEVAESSSGRPYIAMEYCEGETLSQRIRRRPFESGEFIRIARQIAAGLAAAHANGVVHRDIKAANVMIEPTGVVKILDFGLAKIALGDYAPGEKQSFESTSGHFFGTLHYLSPEQVRGQRADERSDLFSVGILLYQMASARLPFDADSVLGVIEKIRESEPEPFTPVDPLFPPAATKVIRKLLQKRPEERYQRATDLLADLEAIEVPTTRQHSRRALGRTLSRPRWSRLAMLAAVFIAIVLVGVHASRQRSLSALRADRSTPPPPIRSVAVLPLDNLANSERDEFLSVGLADALVTKLQQIPSLQVRPTSAIVQYHGSKVDVRRASEELGVDGVLEGHYLSAGDLVRVTLQLTDARTGYSVWADTIDGKRANLLALIDAVSSRTTQGLDERLGIRQPFRESSKPRSDNPKAFEEYLRARALNGTLVQKDFNAEVAFLQNAIRLDSKFAAAYADLAITTSLGVARGLVTDADALQKAEWYARQAVRLDPNLAAGHLALGRVFVRNPERYRESVRESLAAVRLNPSETQSLWTIATYFISTGEIDKAQCVGNRLVNVDPQSNDAKARGYWYINAIDPEGAINAAQYALASKETAIAGHDIRGVAFILQGKLDEAQNEADAAASLSPAHYIPKSLRAMIAAAKGDRAATEAAIASFQTDAARNHWAAIRVALCYAKLGDRDRAMQWLERSAALGHHSWYEMVKHPWLQGLQADPQFQALLGRIKADLDDVRDDVVGLYQMICR